MQQCRPGLLRGLPNRIVWGCTQARGRAVGWVSAHGNEQHGMGAVGGAGRRINRRMCMRNVAQVLLVKRGPAAVKTPPNREAPVERCSPSRGIIQTGLTTPSCTLCHPTLSWQSTKPLLPRSSPRMEVMAERRVPTDRLVSCSRVASSQGQEGTMEVQCNSWVGCCHDAMQPATHAVEAWSVTCCPTVRLLWC